mmetsp:Transcript_1938/g.6961  ORF Transcript_1938/g.6961 Transcript_1938/m.6961 type:complete len:317 (-) Transcript_1938:1332-2282(-)
MCVLRHHLVDLLRYLGGVLVVALVVREFGEKLVQSRQELGAEVEVRGFHPLLERIAGAQLDGQGDRALVLRDVETLDQLAQQRLWRRKRLVRRDECLHELHVWRPLRRQLSDELVQGRTLQLVGPTVHDAVLCVFLRLVPDRVDVRHGVVWNVQPALALLLGRGRHEWVRDAADLLGAAAHLVRGLDHAELDRLRLARVDLRGGLDLGQGVAYEHAERLHGGLHAVMRALVCVRHLCLRSLHERVKGVLHGVCRLQNPLLHLGDGEHVVVLRRRLVQRGVELCHRARGHLGGRKHILRDEPLEGAHQLRDRSHSGA